MERSAGVQFVNDRMTVRFDRFGTDSYELFLKCKRLPEYDIQFDDRDETYTISAPARFASMLGATSPIVQQPPLPFSPRLFDDQKILTTQALEAKRYAIWSQCGNGKTLIGLEFARQVVARTRGRFLIVTLHEIVGQWIEEASRFYSDVQLHRLKTRQEMREWAASGDPRIAITNYEKFNPAGVEDQDVTELRHLAGIALDESSRLKTGGGKQKWAIIKSTKGIEYKLSLTATPAPNDTIEFASQAAFLEKMRTDADIIWTYFSRDPVSQKWTVKPHARRAFFEFMSSWSVYVNNPKSYGWRLDQPEIPPPVYETVEVPITVEQREHLQKLTTDQATGQVNLFGGESNSAIRRNKLSQIAKGFAYFKDDDGRRSTRIPSKKPKAIQKILKQEHAAGAQVLIWTVYDEESEILRELLPKVDPSCAWITGKTEDEERLTILDRFRKGEIRTLVSRARMLGFGMNFQHCTAMIFSGWTDSFEDLYQAVRRAVRHGQSQSVRVYFPIVRELEGDVFENVQRKQVEFERAIAEMETSYLRARGVAP